MPRALLFVLVLAALAAGCGGGDDEESGYPPEAVESFVAECTKQPNASAESCRCVIERLQQSMPFSEFERADAALRENRTPEEGSVVKLQTAAEACR